MNVLASSGRVLQLNAPEWFRIPAFVEMINRAKCRVATFHEQGTLPGEYSDVFLPFDTIQVGVDSMGNEVWRGDGSDIFHIDDLHSLAADLVRVARNCGIERGIAWICNLP